MLLEVLALSASVVNAPPVSAPIANDNVHMIYCHENKMTYQGTGWFIKDGIMATAFHVGRHTQCTDATTDEPIQSYVTDKKHDFALMSGSHGKSVIKYSCKAPKPGKLYRSYGFTSHFPGGDFWNPLPLVFDLIATNEKPIFLSGLDNLEPMRKYVGRILAGMSGGPVIEVATNVAYALNNAGNDQDTYLYDLADTALCTGKWDK